MHIVGSMAGPIHFEIIPDTKKLKYNPATLSLLL